MADQTLLVYAKYWPPVAQAKLSAAIEALLAEQKVSVTRTTVEKRLLPERYTVLLQNVSKLVVTDTSDLRRKAER